MFHMYPGYECSPASSTFAFIQNQIEGSVIDSYDKGELVSIVSSDV